MIGLVSKSALHTSTALRDDFGNGIEGMLKIV
eukprot:SAG31_NODE_36030_length_317_cov_0.715596_1_plen_31_part_10